MPLCSGVNTLDYVSAGDRWISFLPFTKCLLQCMIYIWGIPCPERFQHLPGLWLNCVVHVGLAKAPWDLLPVPGGLLDLPETSLTDGSYGIFL